MAYSAALGETDVRYFDTAQPGGVLAHPLFPVCYEWPVSQPIRQILALREVYQLLVHAEHDLVLHRAPRDGDRLQVRVRITAVQKRRPGAFVVFRFEAHDAAGAPVSTTDFGVLYRGVEVQGEDRGSPMALRSPRKPAQRLGDIDVGANLAHVYTECARIFNPIHTDVAYARRAGLPGIILHGTATLALSVSRVLAACSVSPAEVRRVQCRFTGMVLMPAQLAVYGAPEDGGIAFETRGAGGEAVISRGWIALDG